MINENIKIGGIEKFSIVDFPNVISAVIFMQGCPWRCPFCHNKELQDVNYNTDIDWIKVLDFLKKRKLVLDGVVFSGGEPLVQPQLIEAIKEVKPLGYKIGLHTGGYFPARLKEVVNLVDWVGLDIKAPFGENIYKKITGGIAEEDKVKESLEILVTSGVDFECRTTCDPRFLSINDIYKIAEQLKESGVKKYYLQKYRKVASDNDTAEGQCLALVEDENLLNYLKNTFEVFEVRI